MTQVNLLPGEVLDRQRSRRWIAVIGAAGLSLCLLLVLVYLFQSRRLSEAEQELAAQQAANQGLQSQIAELQRFEEMEQRMAEREALAGQLLQGRILWSQALRDVSRVIPGDMWLTSLSASLSGAEVPQGTSGSAPATTAPPGEAAPAAPAPGSGLIGRIDFQGVAFGQQAVAMWLNRLEEVTGWANSWITSSAKSAEGTEAQFTFTGSVDLTAEATDRSLR